MPAWKINNGGHCKQSGNENLELKTEEEEELYKVGCIDDITMRTKSDELFLRAISIKAPIIMYDMKD